MLTDLNLATNDIGNEGAVAIADALKSGMSMITKLALKSNGLDGNSEQLLRDAATATGRELVLEL